MKVSRLRGLISMGRRIPAILGLLMAAGNWAAVDAQAPDIAGRAAEEFFEKHIRPALADHCFECHGAMKQQGGLRLDSREGLLKGNDTGPVVSPGKPDESRMIDVIGYAPGDIQMPPKGKLPDELIRAFEQWIAAGAVWPALESGHAGSPAGASAGDATLAHWAFRPVHRPRVPDGYPAAWPQSPIDTFVSSRLLEHGLSPAAPADRRTLLRRVKFALLGLPPTADEVIDFEQDQTPGAYVKRVDRFLAAPRYGERWARHWLDVARYADTKGYVFEEDRNYPAAYTYRDWTIRALGADMPYDRFLMFQLAADRLTTADNADEQAAMGYLTLGRRFLNNKHDIIDDRIDVVMRGMQALTVACARCHDHKYDPIPTEDYYSLYGVFDASREPGGDPSPLRLVDEDDPREPVVFLRGSSRSRGERVPRRFVKVLSGEDRRPFTDGSGRLELARAIADAQNPLTARVIVNRIWQWHFGRGLVDTASDFGLRSEPPTHPDVLDWLACELAGMGAQGAPQHVANGDGGLKIENGRSAVAWSVKRLQRQILLSSVSQQSSHPPSFIHQPSSSDSTSRRAANPGTPDPENRLFSHFPRQRLDFEAQRDALLAVAGRLDQRMYGPAVKLMEDGQIARRTVYGFIDRQNLPKLYRTFDFAGPDTHNPGRFTTTVPQQALFLLNSPFVMQQAERVAALTVVVAGEPAAQVSALYQIVYGRIPTEDELRVSSAWLESSEDAPATERTGRRRRPQSAPLSSLARLAQVLLASNEFVYVD